MTMMFMDGDGGDKPEHATALSVRTDDRIFVLRVDGGDTIRLVNEAWLQFGRENAPGRLEAGAVLNKPLWNFVASDSVVALIQNLMHKVRRTGAALKIPFRCDSPGSRRFMEMEIVSRPPHALEFRSRLLREERRETVRLLDAGIARADDWVTACSWCNRLKVSDELWTEVEEGIRLLNLFGRENPPRLTHGICPDCARKLEASAEL